MTYLLRRAGLSLAHILALSLVSFLLLSIAPGHFLSAERMDPQRSRAALEAWTTAQGLDRPWTHRYAAWLSSCAGGGCGTSLAYGTPVAPLVTARLRRTAAVALPAWLAGWLLGLAAALAAARFPWLGRVAEPAAATSSLLPEVVLGGLLLWLAVRSGLPVDSAWLPATILALPLAAVVFLHAASALTAARATRFAQLAQARGIGGVTFWRWYVLPAAANPLISLLAPSLVGLIGSALAVEALTGWPGLGPLFLDAFHSRDYPVVQGVLLLLGAALTTLGLAGDLLLYQTDRRIRIHHDTRR